MHPRYKQYLWILGTVILICTGGLACLNLFVSPFGAYPLISLRQLEPYRDHSENRIAKAELIARGECEVLILGTSRAQVGLLPTHPAFHSTRVYNLGLRGSNLYETQYVFDFALRNNDIKQIVMSVDFLMFSAVRLPGDYFEASRFNPNFDVTEYYLKNLLGLHATRSSWEVLDAWRHNREVPPPGHGFVVKRIPPGRQQRTIFEDCILGFLKNPETYGGYIYSPERVEIFRRMVQTCLQRHINLVVIIPPVHALELETVRVANLWPEFERWKTDLVRVLAEEGATQTVPLWDFTGYEGYRTEPVPPPGDRTTRMHWYLDSSHFTPALGNLALDRVFGQTSPATVSDPQFGVLLTSQNLALHLADTRAQRENYAHAYPNEIAWMEQLAAKKKVVPGGRVELPTKGL